MRHIRDYTNDNAHPLLADGLVFYLPLFSTLRPDLLL
nr:MAG TPA: hypothetical protein [Caudoviricetes sp.]